MRICVLGSGSSGNCIYVGSSTNGLLVDAGFSGRETLKRLEAAGIDQAGIRAILVTHEHGDHVSGLAVLSRRLKAEVYANSATIEAVEQGFGERSLAWNVFTTGFAFHVGDIAVEPFTVCHDARDPVGFVLTADGVRAGIVTDIGMTTTLVREKLRNCSVLVLEANHDEKLLRDANRPWALKQRIAGRQGHLCNQHAAELVAECAGPDLTHVFLAHLSADCNRPDLAVRTVLQALGEKGPNDVRVVAAFQDRPGEMWNGKGLQNR